MVRSVWPPSRAKPGQGEALRVPEGGAGPRGGTAPHGRAVSAGQIRAFPGGGPWHVSWARLDSWPSSCCKG